MTFLPGGNKSIRIDKPADIGVIVSGLKVVKAAFFIIVITPISERVFVRYVVRVALCTFSLLALMVTNTQVKMPECW